MLCDFVPLNTLILPQKPCPFWQKPCPVLPETLSLCRKPCPIIQEPMFSQAKITVLLCQNHFPIMPKSLSYNARTPVLLCQNPCPYQARIPVQQARTPVLLGQKPCPFIPKPQKFLKKNYLFFQETLFYFAKDRVQKHYYFPPAQNLTFCLRNPVFCSQTIFLSPFSVRNQSSLSEPCWYFSLLAVGCKPTRARRRGKRA